MKTILSSLSALLLTAWLGCLSTELIATAETGKPTTQDAHVDSDGDGTPDASDPNPFIAEVAGISWRIGQMAVGWKFNASIEELKTTHTEDETQVLHQNELSFGAKGETSAELSTQAKAKFSFNPLKLFGLSDSGAEAIFQTRFAASGDVAWSKSDRERASDLTRLISQTQIAHKLSDLNLEFTVLFFNFGDDDFIGENLQIPIKTGENVSAIAQPVGANGPESRIRIPAHRDRSIPIRFRASLDTTQSLALLRAMAQGSLSVSIEESQGSITSMKDEKIVDAMSALTQIRRKCCKLTIEVEGKEFQWFVARRNAMTTEPLHLSDAFGALNALVAHQGGGSGKLFEYTDRYLRSAAGRDCSITPVRWWVSISVGGTAAETGIDVNPVVELPNGIRLREMVGFPADMKRWVSPTVGADAWELLVAGELLYKGIAGVEADKTRALVHWQKAVDLGDPRGMEILARHYLNADGVQNHELTKIVELCQRASSAGDPFALAFIAECYADGKGGYRRDENEAVRYFQRAADAGDALAMYTLARYYFVGKCGLDVDKKKSVELWQKAVDLGVTAALVPLGQAYLSGRAGVPKDEIKAVVLWQKAADLGETEALFELGWAHIAGWGGLPKDEKQAVELWQKAADQGHSEAMSQLAQGYAYGRYGLSQDTDRAAELERKAGKKSSN